MEARLRAPPNRVRAMGQLETGSSVEAALSFVSCFQTEGLVLARR